VKAVVIILLLSSTGLEEIRLTGNNCGIIAENWRAANTTHVWEVDGDPKRQGNYTKDDKLLVGYICDEKKQR